MTEEELIEECLEKFPNVLKDALTGKPKVKRDFLRKVKKEYSEVLVYRGLRNEEVIVDEDFYSHNELALLGMRDKGNLDDWRWYSVSVNEDRDQLINSLDIPSEEKHIFGIAKGTMKCEYGPADGIGKTTHHNWFIYNGAISHLKEQFKIEPIIEKKSDNYE